MLNVLDKDIRIDNINEINFICEQNNVDVFILGVGVYSRALSMYLKKHGLKFSICYVVDDKYMTDELLAKGVIGFSFFMDNYKRRAPLILGFFDFGKISQKFKQYQEEIMYRFDFHIVAINDVVLDWSFDFYRKNQKQFEETFDMLCSDYSKNVMQSYLNATINGEISELYNNYRDNIPYFQNNFINISIDRLFDCGAYDGDSAHDFIAAFDNYDHIFEFEPDGANIEKIKKRVKNENIRDLTIIQKGVWSETKTLWFFSEGKSSSCISEEGNSSIEVIRLDDLYNKFTKNSLIKMDIEGSELEALKGAERVIREISPALAICVYHRTDDLITIPQYIKGLVPNGTYEYYIGYQGDGLAELVFYAIPSGKKDD